MRDQGREALGEVLTRSRPLADLLWMRETAGGVFDTPERRAELEQRLQALARTVGDESVRRHYAQDMRERLNAFFAPPAGSSPQRGSYDRVNRRDGGGGQGGWQGKGQARGGGNGGGAARRTVASDRLIRSPMMSAGRETSGAPSTREVAIVVGFINHPLLFREAFDYFAELDLGNGPIGAVHSAVLDIYADALPHQRAEIVAGLAARGLAETFETFEASMRRVRLWSVLEDAAVEDARETVRQALHLHNRTRALASELKRAQEDAGTEASERAFAQLNAIREEILSLSGTEALIDGFGILSGKPSRGS